MNTAELFCKGLHLMSEKNPGIHVRSYSGRGMFGNSCVGVVCNSFGVLLLGLSELYNSIACSPQDFSDHEDFGEFLDTFKDVSTDSMGMDMIFYWPDVEFILNKNKDDNIVHSVAVRFVPVLINNDNSGLSDDEIESLDAFEEEVISDSNDFDSPIRAYWSLVDGSTETAKCAITGELTQTRQVKLNFDGC